MKSARINVYLKRDHERRLIEFAAAKRISRSAVVAAALFAYLSPDGGARREAATAKRIEKLTQQFDRLERDQAILIETLALFIRHYFIVAPSIHETHQEAAKAQGKLRFEQFIEQLARILQRGESLVREVFEEIAPVNSADKSDAEGRPHSQRGTLS
jgi:hypothetical protein